MPLALMLPLASAALLPSTNHAIQSHTASACTLTTTFSKLPAHQAARVPAISMAEAVTVPVAPAASPARPIKFIARWLARAVVLTAIAMTPMLQLHATHLSLALPAPTIAMPAAVSRVLQAALAASRARIAALGALLATAPVPTWGGTPLLTYFAGVTVPTPTWAGTPIHTLPLAIHVGRAAGVALTGSALVCAALPSVEPIAAPSDCAPGCCEPGCCEPSCCGEPLVAAAAAAAAPVLAAPTLATPPLTPPVRTRAQPSPASPPLAPSRRRAGPLTASPPPCCRSRCGSRSARSR